MICLEINNVVIPVHQLIDAELDHQFAKRAALKALGPVRKVTKQVLQLEDSISDSCKKVKYLYSLIDHEPKSITFLNNERDTK